MTGTNMYFGANYNLMKADIDYYKRIYL